MSTSGRLVEDTWFPSVRLGAVVVAWVLWVWNPSWGWTVALALAPWLFQTLAGKLSFRSTFLDTCLVLFLLTAGVGLWAGYDRDGSRPVFSNPSGWQKLWGLFLAALLYQALAATKTRAAQRRALGSLVGLGAVVSVVFVATHDWAAQPAKWGPIIWLGEAIQAPLPPLPGIPLNPNVVGGALALLLPLSLGLAVEVCRRRTWLMAWALLAGGGNGPGTAVDHLSRGLDGRGGSLALAVAWWLTGRVGYKERCLWVFAALVTLGGLAGILAVVGISALRAVTLESFAFTNRLNIFSQAALLVRDYPFTGCELGNSALVHSTYALLVHVPVLSYVGASGDRGGNPPWSDSRPVGNPQQAMASGGGNPCRRAPAVFRARVGRGLVRGPGRSGVDARQDYETALEHTQAAWDAGHRDRVTRLLLGDALVAHGQVEEAAAVVQGLERAELRLNGQAWYRYWVSEDWQRATYAWRAVQLLDPQDAYVGAWVEQAEKRAAPDL
jgi:hypothetical protein